MAVPKDAYGLLIPYFMKSLQWKNSGRATNESGFSAALLLTLCLTGLTGCQADVPTSAPAAPVHAAEAAPEPPSERSLQPNTVMEKGVQANEAQPQMQPAPPCEMQSCVPDPAQSKEPVNTSFAEFNSAYDAMSAERKEEYGWETRGSYVRWSGTVVEVSRDSVTVMVDSDAAIHDFKAIVKPAQSPRLSELTKGDPITVLGRIQGMKSDRSIWTLDDAELVE